MPEPWNRSLCLPAHHMHQPLLGPFWDARLLGATVLDIVRERHRSPGSVQQSATLSHSQSLPAMLTLTPTLRKFVTGADACAVPADCISRADTQVVWTDLSTSSNLGSVNVNPTGTAGVSTSTLTTAKLNAQVRPVCPPIWHTCSPLNLD